jgi:hypothetical protein
MDANVGDLLDACELMSDTSLGDAMNYDSAVDATANVCPVTVSGSTTYGFDLSVKGNAFFEWLGSKDGTLAGGGAYNGNTSGQAGGPDNAMNVLVGDRVFLVQMTTGGSASEAAQADAKASDVAQAGAAP